MKKRTEQEHRKQQRQPSTPQENKSLKPAGPDIGPESVDASLGIPVVGIGGSAGALEPFKTFLTSLPDDSGAAFVIIQHLAPTHESLLPELLAQHTRMRVVQARDAVPVEPNSPFMSFRPMSTWRSAVAFCIWLMWLKRPASACR
jgi:two-component system CheB/CheR fusion protein